MSATQRQVGLTDVGSGVGSCEGCGDGLAVGAGVGRDDGAVGSGVGRGVGSCERKSETKCDCGLKTQCENFPKGYHSSRQILVGAFQFLYKMSGRAPRKH
jgi:hypothetical protein